MGKTLVTGATGFVGAALVRQLIRQGDDVRITVRKTSNTVNIEGIAVEMVEADICRPDSIREAMKGCTHLYHVAGLYRTWMRDYGMLTRVNIEGTENVMNAALQSGIQKVVHTSSIGALGVRADGKPSDEHTAFNLYHLKLPYEQSKYESENVALSYADRGLPVVVVRPALVMGEGDIYPTPSGKLVLDILKKRIPSYFDGGIDVVDVDDVAAGHRLAMEKGTAGESYNIGCIGNFTSLKDLFSAIAEAGNVSPPRFRVPKAGARVWAGALTMISDYITHIEPVASPANIRALALKRKVDFRKAVTGLGIPQTPLSEVVRKTVSWYHRMGYV